MRVEYEDVHVADYCQPLWQALFHWTHVTGETDEEEVRLHFISSLPPRPTNAHPVSRQDGLELWRTVDGYYLACGASALALDTQRGEGWGCIAPEFWQHPLLLQRRFFLLVAMILLHGRRGYVLHANGIVWSENDSALVIGRSGSGKSTLTIGLLHAGGRCLGDDALLLRVVGGRIQAHALRRGFSCTPQTAVHFPTLAEAWAAAPILATPHAYKKLLALETLWPDCFTPHCTPRLLLFPEVSPALHTRLMPLNLTQTLCALMEHSVGILMDAANARRQMAALGHLARQARGYRLYAGHDVYAEPERVAALLRTALQDG